MRRRVAVILDPDYRPWQPGAPPPIRLRRPPRKGWQKALLFLLPLLLGGIIIIALVGWGKVGGGGAARSAAPGSPTAPAISPTPPIRPGPGYYVVQCNGVIVVVPEGMEIECGNIGQ